MRMKVLKSGWIGYLFPMCGILMVTLGYVPYIALGKGSVIGINDQLDGEILTYVLAAKHLFDGQTVYPEIMCGLNREAMMPPAMFSILLYAVFSPFIAFLINQYLILAAAFIGMYLLCNEILKNRIFSFSAAVIFSYLPFFSVYGLSMTGVPLLVYAMLKLYENKNRLLYYGIVMLYCFSSAFYFTGYTVTGCALLISIISFMKGNKRKGFFCASLLLLAGYLIQDYSLILQIMGIGSREASIREEFIIAGMDFWEVFCSVFVNGFAHAISYHKFIIPPAVVVSVYGICRYHRLSKERQKEVKLIWGLLLIAVMIAAFCALFHCHAIVGFRNKAGGIIKYFQIDRFYWFYPAIWYFMLACICSFLYGQMHRKYAAGAICMILLAVTGIFVLWNSNFKKNFRQLVNSETSNQITWEDFYSESLFCEIADYIEEQSGMGQEEYRVGSIGLHPAVAVLNGFYTIDGYSNNYNLSYKHEFREIIAYELSQNEYNRIYFDNWGDRCYIFASEYNGGVILGKSDQVVFSDLILQSKKLKEMSCRYILSAGEIADSEQTGLTLCRIFERDDSYYRIYLYKVIG